jgi:tetratricopeptide (TPR) repeat protein
MRGKWLLALAISILITAGVWFATKDLENQLRDAEIGIEQSNTRFTEQAATIEGIVSKLSPQAQDEVLLQAGGYYRGLWRANKFQAVLDMALPMLEVNPDNGHALYYAGEVYREFGNREQMRGLFQKFIAAAVENPDAKTGAAAACYQRPGGFCQERLGWIYHLMASDYLTSSRTLNGAEKVEALRTAFQYERWDIELRQTVFFDNGSTPASCDILLAIATELTKLKHDVSDIIAFGRDGPGQCATL